MQTTLDCIPCIVRQALESARFVTADPVIHQHLLRHALAMMAGMDMHLPPPYIGQWIHRELRRISGVDDPYRESKERFNRLAAKMLPRLRQLADQSPDPLYLAARVAIAGNIIDLGINGALSEAEARRTLEEALTQPLQGDWAAFRSAILQAKRILYIADNAGEIVFDRLCIEQLQPLDRVTLAVRGRPILNDATREDAAFAGLDRLVHIIDNGSDAPGTILAECSPEFIRAFHQADLIIAKGQGNFETPSDTAAPIFFLFKAKCLVIAAHAGVEPGAPVLYGSR